MLKIPTNISKEDFENYIFPNLSKRKRGPKPKIGYYNLFILIFYKLKTGIQWNMLPLDNESYSYKSVVYHYQKWCKDGSWEKVFQNSLEIAVKSNKVETVNLDGTHSLAKKGGEDVVYQGRKKGKTSNVLMLTNQSGQILACSDIIAGNHHDSFELKPKVKKMVRSIKKLNIKLENILFQGDKAFDTKALRKYLFNAGFVPNIDFNPRNRKDKTPNKRRLFDEQAYKNRFTIERSFAWIDNFRTLLIRFERKSIYWLNWHFLAATLINLKLQFSSFIIPLFWIGESFAQVRPIEDSRELKKFKKYVNSILTQKKDTLSLDTIPKKYRIIYSTSCNYIEHWMGNDACAYGTQGKSFINQAASTIDTLSTDAMFAQIKKPYICAENPVSYIDLEAVFILKNGKLSNADSTSGFDIDITPSYGWRYTPKISYDNGKFLILETVTLDRTGKEKLKGRTTSFFLERDE